MTTSTERRFELLTTDGKTITWNGTSGEDAARRWREMRTFVGPVHHSQIIG